MHIKELTPDQVCKLRSEITLNSLFLGDYKNSFEIDTNEVCDFFDSFIQWAYGIWKENHSDITKYRLSDIDTLANLLDYFRVYKGGLD